MLRSGSSAETILQEKGLQQISSSDELEALVQETIKAHPDEVASYKAGKETLFNWFFGQVMRASQGKADPQKTRQILKDALTE
jgi:aspartyl-tRNA(Asn)/glutamyl-tRNA(Gln) amidotransferase subunit B